MVLDLRINKFLEQSQYIFYDEINRIPLEIIFDEDSLYQEGIEFSNYNEDSFIIFKFSKKSFKISSITFVSINSKNIIQKEFMENIDISKSSWFYNLFLDSLPSSSLRTEEKTSIYLDKSNNMLFSFNQKSLGGIEFFNIDEFLSIGVNDKQELTSILLKGLTEEQVNRLF